MSVTLTTDSDCINSINDDRNQQHRPSLWSQLGCCYPVRSLRDCRSIRFISQCLHASIALTFVVVGMIEFIRRRPLFDALANHELPERIFVREFLQSDNTFRRFTDAPILLFFFFYFGVCSWNRFTGRSSWLMTISLIFTTLIYLYINLWNQHDFDWKYFKTRFNGIFVQIYSISFTMALVLTTFLTKRRRLPFKFKAHFPLYTYSNAHVIWNLVALFVVTSTCLIFWTSRLYISWVCVESLWKISLLCQVTPSVQCYLCDQCVDAELKRCADNASNIALHCYHPISADIADKSAFCTFNYNIGILTFITVFAYVGGLWVFLHGFLSAFLHYTVILGRYIWQKARKKFGTKRSGVFLFENDHLDVVGNLDDDSNTFSESSLLNDRDLSCSQNSTINCNHDVTSKTNNNCSENESLIIPELSCKSTKAVFSVSYNAKY
ncbi:uncharacterized protein TRIADDRAFT_57894 [Trichoplax adhaerens]|uniref:Uncharacterized protein n=1 Tax=Trichoplax adhaerens TaxID=10228 RepID=B3S222_TRIAD|nr:hypothetical protein TRIADDRAFT_57894 [Trichoplax adhaerens]EDV23357.1 hypothetical protein TRIADDRAFT_57894 [Trichoplax adhaerens]|eukprot:XP_002114267.1 hypothetical protein TRIADDRAFT_57894 [Trichoplax adhaerens]